MRHRLFWKILIGFWITFIIMMEGLWVTFALYDEAESPLWDFEADARMKLEALSGVLQSGGSVRLKAVMDTWPSELRKDFAVRTVDVPNETDDTDDIIESGDRLTLITHDPTGAAWELSYDLRPIRAELEDTGMFELPPDLLATGAIGGLLFSTALAWYLARPIQILQGGFRRLAEGALDTRLQKEMGRRRDEIADLARDFDQMAARLQQLVTVRDQLLHDVSHELRSPLARLQVATDLVRQNPQRLDAALDRVDAETHRLDELVGELLTLSRLESGVQGFDGYFDLGDLLRKVINDARFEAEASHIYIVTDIGEEELDENTDLTLKGDAELMRRALENIVRNAIHHTPAGGQVFVKFARETTQHDFEIRIEDQGPGVPDPALESIFEPFVRIQDVATNTAVPAGFGLGLAIARRAIQAHGGTIRAKNREPHGLEVEIRLPPQMRTAAHR